MPKDDLLRFVTDQRHPPYGHRTGVFQAAYSLLRDKTRSEAELAQLRQLLDWFNEHLAKPERLAASRRPHAERTAISWIRASARDHVVRLRRMAKLVEATGVVVEELRTARPGYILYEDLNQVIALPFVDTPR